MEATITTMEPTRGDAITDLIQAYQIKHDRHFYIDPSLSFVSGENGSISVHATKDISKGTGLLSLPDAERVSLSNIQSKEIKKILQKVETKYLSIQHKSAPFGCLDNMYRYTDICLAVAIMYDCANNKDYTNTWPHLNDLRDSCYKIWWDPSPDFRELLKGTFTLQTLDRYAGALRYAFEECVQPVLSASDRGHFIPTSFQDPNQMEMENLWEAFRYASSMVRSRAHTGRSGDSEIIPIVDLINGLPCYCTEKINVAIENVNWMTTNLVAVQDIAAGQELIIDYGDNCASFWTVRYACCPKEVVAHPRVSLDMVNLHVPSFLTPPDKLRADACRKSGFPTEPDAIESEMVHLLIHHGLAVYKESQCFQGETDELKYMRQFLMLCHVMDDKSVQINLATGRFKGNNPNLTKLGQLHLLVLDHTIKEITSLDTSTNQEDFDKAASAATPTDLVSAYHTRICQRDTMAQWRHAFCRRHGYPSEHVKPTATDHRLFYEWALPSGDVFDKFPRPNAPNCLVKSWGCYHCGRTLDLKACSKCKQVKYCCRDHQRIDWKLGHKKVCK